MLEEQTGHGSPVADVLRRVGALFEPFSPAYADSPARALYQTAHRDAPVAYSEAFSAYLVTGHAEVTQVLRDPVVFSSAHILDLPPDLPEEVAAELRRGVYEMPPALFNNDPPGHTRARALFSRAFTPARVASLEPTIAATADALVRAMAPGGGPVDLMQALAFPLPLQIIAALVGIPIEDAPLLRACQDERFKLYEPGVDTARKVEAARRFVSYERYLTDLIERRRAEPADDLITALIRARVDGEAPLSMEEMISHIIVMFFAGYETVASLIGSLVLRLLEAPALWDAIGSDAALLQAAIEETLRIDAPVQMEPRRAKAPAVVGGVEIPAGATAFAFFGAANHDPTVFPDPQRFDVGRPVNPRGRHLGFGFGVHTCIGAPLARIEVRCAVQALRAAFPGLRLAGEGRPSYAPSMFFRKPAAVPVTLGGR
ncbi:cytochrome P450 [Sorangium sp. So ce1099]|uniref:cytochrome P450 n=1 Tax=Sorangium sp. So ce1099 TaxID=3133331 RepID=UPI003F63C54F